MFLYRAYAAAIFFPCHPYIWSTTVLHNVYYSLFNFVAGRGVLTAMSEQEVLETFQVSLGDVLAFATGASAIPPMGFNPTPAIKFHSTSPFPLANTCANTLSLPLFSHSHEGFKHSFCYGICNAIGFGQV